MAFALSSEHPRSTAVTQYLLLTTRKDPEFAFIEVGSSKQEFCQRSRSPAQPHPGPRKIYSRWIARVLVEHHDRLAPRHPMLAAVDFEHKRLAG